MRVRQYSIVLLGVIATLCEITLLVFNIIFAVTLSMASTSLKINGVEIVASVLNFVNMSLLSIFLVRQVQYQNGIYVQDNKHGRQHTYLLAGLCGDFCALSVTATAVGLCIIRNEIADLPRQMLGSSTEGLVTGAFIVWAISLVSGIGFIVAIVLIDKMDSHRQMQSFQVESGNHSLSKMETTSQQKRSSPDSADHEGSNSVTSITLPPPIKYSSFRNSLISKHNTTQSPESRVSGYPMNNPSIEDGFNFWDTPTAEPYARQVVLGKSSTSKFLGPVPATPTGSRCPSPRIPLDLELAAKAATQGPDVTAALGPGQIVSDCRSIKSLHYTRSGSLFGSPLVASCGVDN
ncbi:hypothetical protein B7463_g8513, partial [Scytalidium lignicola]